MNAMETNWEDKELTALEYARLHGICVDYTTEPFPSGDLRAPSDATIDQDLHLPLDTSITNAISGLARERLTINKDAALLLKSVYALPETCTSHSLAINKRAWLLSLKQEIPLLKTDSEMDRLSFGSAGLPSLEHLTIPFEVTDEERDEGLEWPSEYYAYPAQCDGQAKTEKIAIAKDVLVYIQDMVRDSYIPEDSETIKTESLRSKPRAALQITPPLLPLSPPLTPYVPSSPANRVPLAINSSDSLTTELRDIEDQIIGSGTLDLECSDINDSVPLDLTLLPQLSSVDEDQALPTLKFKTETLKVEGPLTPPIFSTSPMRKLKCVSFAETLHEFIPNSRWADTLTDEDSNASIDLDDCFRDLEPLVTKVRKSIENERLSGADTTARVEVPEIDSSLPIAPWNEYNQGKGHMSKSGVTELDLQTKFLLRVQHDDLRGAATWHGVTALERELRWNVFMANVAPHDINEQLHGETDLQRILTEPFARNVATSFSQVWKREGLRILDDEEEEEIIEPLEVGYHGDIEALIRKRKSEYEEDATETQKKRRGQSQHVLPAVHKFRSLLSSANSLKLNQGDDHDGTQNPGRSVSKVSPSPDSDLMFGGFSVTTALHKFMETRGKVAKRTYMEEDKPSATEKSSTSTWKPALGNPNVKLPAFNMGGGNRLIQTKERSCWENHQSPLLPDLPTVPENLAPCSFIVSSILLNRRNLMRQIESLYPEADMVYRDYNLPQSPSQEADFILSPSTGLIITTLQQVKQRALPGQPNRSPVKERMNVLQIRYERLIVMIGEGLSCEMEDFGSSRPEDLRNQEVLEDFENFAAELDGEVLVKYVRGGERAFAHSILVEMIKYGLPHGSVDLGNIKPLAVETSWEVFLRRVGLNPFAAQVIIASLKHPVNVRVSGHSNLSNLSNLSQDQTMVSISGLPAFIAMNVEDRVLHFQVFMGGSRILKRVSNILDQEWISAAHGFQL